MKRQTHRICLLTICSFMSVNESMAVTFNTSLLAGDSGNSDLSRFYENQDIPAGQQDMDIYINGSWKGRYSLRFGASNAEIYIKKSESSLLGLNLSDLPKDDSQDSYLLEQLVQGGDIDIDTSTMSIKLTVPQSYVNHSEAGYVAPEFWDNGVPALLFSYNSTYYKTKGKHDSRTSDDDFYTGLESGFNLGGWQFRDSSAFRKHSGQKAEWQNNTRYIRKPIASIKSNFVAGDFYSPGSLFDSVRVRGASLSSDINMRPNSQQGFSPVVRGIAETNALVKVIQNGNVIYQENVPPGQFTLDSIQPTGSAGDLLVVVKEANGQEQSFTVPFSSVPNMIKAGVSKYSLLAGKVHQSNTDYDPAFVQGTFEYGFNNLVTGYAGTIQSDNYRAYLLGTGWNFPIGAISVDLTHANTRLQTKSDSGQSMRISYSKFLDTTATNFTLAAYRYSTKGYYSFNDAIYSHDSYNRYQDYIDNIDSINPDTLSSMDLSTWDSLRSARPKNTFTLNLNQRLADGWGTVFLSGTQRDYWTQNQKSREYQLGYSNAYQRVNYSISASRIRNSSREEETRYYLSLSVPLSIFNNDSWLSAGLSTTGSHYQQSNLTVSGNALESNRLSYSLSGSNQNSGQNMASANLAYRSRVSTLGVSFSESNDYHQGGLSARGSVVAIPWNILASNEMGNTLTVVKAPNAEGLMVNGDESIVTNSDGLALISYATPYRKNAITLSNTDNASGAEVIGNIANSVPYDGAVNVIKFETDTRQSWTFRATQADGKALPFGAEALDASLNPIGFVGQSSVLYIKADEIPKSIIVRLKKGSCTITNPPLTLDDSSSYCQ